MWRTPWAKNKKTIEKEIEAAKLAAAKLTPLKKRWRPLGSKNKPKIQDTSTPKPSKTLMQKR